MNWMLRDDVHAAAVGRDLVILDLASDSYACLRDAGAEGDDFARRVDRLSAAAQRTLTEAGLLVPGMSPGAPPPTAIAKRPLPALSSSSSDLRLLLDAAFAQLDLRSAGPDPSVAVLVARATAGVKTGEADPALVFRTADQFRRLAPWLPGRRACLQRAALLRRLLQCRGLSASWMFGVRTWPFRAHCWLQIADVCLTDDPDHLRPYTPILVC